MRALAHAVTFMARIWLARQVLRLSDWIAPSRAAYAPQEGLHEIVQTPAGLSRA